ncbi:MAG: hypothetical protein K8I02_09715, partial [Candidatus Methylomirabilis sp.]|nr:hypothetical protein [Deltaproteobacteria bacterium]
MEKEAYVFRTNPWFVARPVILLLSVGMPLFMGIDYWIFGRQLIAEHPEVWLYAILGYPFGLVMAAVGGWGLYRLAYLLADQTVTVDARGIRIRDWTGAERGYRWEEIEDSNLWRRRSP